MLYETEDWIENFGMENDVLCRIGSAKMCAVGCKLTLLAKG